MNPPMTWKQAREDVASLYEGLLSARDSANEAVQSPSREIPVGMEYREAFCDLRWEVEHLAARAERLLEMLAESPEPEKPRLEAVLADIRALGHECIELRVAVWKGEPYTKCSSHLGAPARTEEGWAIRPFDEWTAAVEHGEATVESGDILAAAEARLEQMRELREQQRAAVVALVETLSYRPRAAFVWAGFLTGLLDGGTFFPARPEPYEFASPYDDATHIVAGAGFVHIEDGQDGRYVIGRYLVGAADSPQRWWVIDRGEDGTGATRLYHYAESSDAVLCRDHLNTVEPEHPEVQPITGPTDAEEAEAGVLTGPVHPGDQSPIAARVRREILEDARRQADEAWLASEERRRLAAASEEDRS